MIKLKHNKKRNTAFLYEALIRELTRAAMKQDIKYKKEIVNVIKECFSKDKILAKELDLYRTLSETFNLKLHVAEKMLFEVKRAYSSMDKKKIYDSQSHWIKRINKKLSKNVFSNFVPNYKNLATISQLFDGEEQPVKQRIILEQKIIDGLVTPSSTKDQSKNMKSIDNVVYRSFVEKFNSTYGSLSEKQQKLLSKYVSSFGDGDIEFKVYLNEELGKVKSNLASLIKGGKHLEGDMSKRAKNILEMVENFKDIQIDSKMLSKVLKIQELVEELQK